MGESVPIKCLNCGREKLIEFARAKRAKYCSRSCATTYYNTTHYRGENNPMWRGGRALAYGPGWKKKKQEIRERDKVCRHCGKTPEKNGRALDVHHIDPFRFSLNNADDNLKALCRSCHMKAPDHGRKGTRAYLASIGKPRPPTRRQIRQLKQLTRAAEAKARRRHNQRAAKELHAKGLSLREIGRELGVSHQIVNRCLKGDYTVREAAPEYRLEQAS